MSTVKMHGTTILSVRRGDRVVIGGDGQVTLGDTMMKGNARKVRRLHGDNVIAGFAGGTADAFTLFERFEGKLQKHQGNLTRAAVELSKDWRTDRMLRRLEALGLWRYQPAWHGRREVLDQGENHHPALAGWHGRRGQQGRLRHSDDGLTISKGQPRCRFLEQPR